VTRPRQRIVIALLWLVLLGRMTLSLAVQAQDLLNDNPAAGGQHLRPGSRSIGPAESRCFDGRC
jgi:hypothetical protein